VLELEQRLQLREANKKSATQPLSSGSFIRTELSAGGFVSEAEQAAFQQRLRDARQKAEALAAKRSEEETNILRLLALLFLDRISYPGRYGSALIGINN
jgi:uncharacterized membrane protein